MNPEIRMIDDEIVLLYYLKVSRSRRTDKATFRNWLFTNEITDINVDNAFDLLSAKGKMEDSHHIELDVEEYRSLLLLDLDAHQEYAKCVEKHTALASKRFRILEDDLDNECRMFVNYIIDEKVDRFGVRWKEEQQEESIGRWESAHNIEKQYMRYNRCLQVFIDNNLVYPSEYTAYNNVREYALYPSLRDYLFNQAQILQFTVE